MSSDFEKDIDKFAKLVGTTSSKVVALTALELFSDVVTDTPIDKGRAQASWRFTKNRVDTSVEDETEGDKGILTVKKFSNRLGLAGSIANKFDAKKDTIFISNNLDYIIPLEEGSSEQAPNGMLTRNVKKWLLYIKTVVKRAT